MKRATALAAWLVVLAGWTPSRADVDLVTLPRREATQLTIYNSEDITMVREHRLLTVKKGINRIQFSWANTLIDPTSIDFRILDQQDKVELIDTTFPAGRNDALQWNVHSKIAGKIAVEIRYFTSGITWTADYVGVADEDETRLDLTGYVRVYNNSGETYDNAQVRLVVGTINLVEKIADLAQKPAPAYKDASTELRKKMQDRFSEAVALGAEGPGGAPAEPKQVIKEGLSEYFLFTIEGRETIKHGEPRRLAALNVKGVPLERIYKLTDRDGGKAFVKYYRFKNLKLLDDHGKEKPLPAMENLGLSPLPDGMVRLFSEYANKDLAYVGGTATKYVPIGDRVEVSLGPDSDITIIRRLKDQKIHNLVARQYERVVRPGVVQRYDLIDYDETFYYEEEIVSGKKVDVMADLERKFDANVILWGNGPKPNEWDSRVAGAYVDLHNVESRIEQVDQNFVKYFLNLKPGKKFFASYSVTYRHLKVGAEFNVQ